MTTGPLPAEIRPVDRHDRAWVRQILAEFWGTPEIVTRGRLHRADRLPGLVALDDGRKRIGLLTYRFEEDACEIVSLNALTRGRGVGTALVSAAREAAADAGCRRIWLITTNDNTPAMRFYERRGFRQSAVYRDALDRSRVLKPEIPELGVNGVPIRDEVEYEIVLAGSSGEGAEHG